MALERNYLKLCNEYVYGNGNILFLDGLRLYYVQESNTCIVWIIRGIT